MVNPELKTCARCKQVLPKDLFGFKKGTRDGLSCRCLACNRETDKLRRVDEKDRRNLACKEWYKRNKDKVLLYRQLKAPERALRRKWQRAFEKMLKPEIPANHKWCPKCKKFLEIIAFPLRTLRGIKKPGVYCRPCEKLASRAKYKNDPEILAKRAVYERQRYQKLKQQDPEGMRIKFLTIAHRRRERQRKNGDRCIVQLSVYKEVFKRDGYRCLKCGATARLEIDHIVPITCGGQSVLDNLQVLCRSCNACKHTKTIDYRESARA